jgi:hypothetical protein
MWTSSGVTTGLHCLPGQMNRSRPWPIPCRVGACQKRTHLLMRGSWISKSEPVRSKSSSLKVKLTNRLIDQIKSRSSQSNRIIMKLVISSILFLFASKALASSEVVRVYFLSRCWSHFCFGLAVGGPSNLVSRSTCVLVVLVHQGGRKSPWRHDRGIVRRRPRAP